MRITYEIMYSEFKRVLLKSGFTEDRASRCAELFAGASRDGVYTHGLNRFPRFIKNIEKGYVIVAAVPEKVEGFGALERWDGKMGPGNLNADFCMKRAAEISHENGIGCVALRNTNHWMRAGSYGLTAIEEGCIGICWTNTMPNMPPWGAKECKVGNNPIVLAVPSDNGPIILDVAMSMFSYGKLESYAMSNKMLPVDGGYDSEGNLSRDPHEIRKTRQPVPIGYWKGSGLSILLDLITMILSGGKSTFEIGKLDDEIALTQTFIAIDYKKLGGQGFIQKAIDDIIADLHSSTPVVAGERVYYPGERMMETRKYNIENGIPVEESFWKGTLEL